MAELNFVKVDISVPVTLPNGVRIDPTSWMWETVARLKGRRLAVFGATGTGKTTWLHRLWRIEMPGDALNESTEDEIPYSVKLNRATILFHDSPGQEGNHALREMIIRARDSDFVGIVNVVSYGILDSRAARYEQPRSDEKDDLLEYFARRRASEIEFLKKHLYDPDSYDANKVRKNLKFVLTVVNKFDLWHHQADEVLSHYRDGEYGKLLSGFGDSHMICGCAAESKFGYYKGKLRPDVFGLPPDESVIGSVNGHCVESVAAALAGGNAGKDIIPRCL